MFHTKKFEIINAFGTNVNNTSTMKKDTNVNNGIVLQQQSLRFEDALEMCKFGIFNYILISFSGIILTVVFLETMGISFIIPVSECDLQLTSIEKGLLCAIGFVGIIVSSHLWGYLADTIGRRTIMLPTLLLTFLFSILSSLSSNFWLFLLFRFLNGFFVSGSSATIYAYLGEFHTNKYRSSAIMSASVIFGIAGIILPIFAWLFINQTWSFYIPIINVMYKPWRLFLLICGTPNLLCAMIMFILPESPKYLLSKGKMNEAIDVLKFIHHFNNNSNNNGGKNETLIIDAITIIDEIDGTDCDGEINNTTITKLPFNLFKSMWQQTSPLFNKDNYKTTIIACVMQFIINATSNGVFMWFPEILNRIAIYRDSLANSGQPITLCEILSNDIIIVPLQSSSLITNNDTMNMSSLATSPPSPEINVLYEKIECSVQLDVTAFEQTIILEILYTIGIIIIGIIINKIGKFPIVFFVLIGCGIGGILIVFVQTPTTSIYLYVILLLCGLSMPIVNAATIDLYPTNIRAMAICICLMMGRLGSIVGTNVIGLLFDNFCQLAYTLSGSSLIMCGFLAYFIPNITQREKNNSSDDDRLSVIDVESIIHQQIVTQV